MLPKFAKTYDASSVVAANRRTWPSNIAFKVMAAALPLLVVFLASDNNVVLELASPAAHGNPLQPVRALSPSQPLDDFAFGFLEFDWEPGQVPGFGPLHPIEALASRTNEVLLVQVQE